MPRFAVPEGRVGGRRSTNELLHKVLELARARTGMEVAAVSRFEDGKQVIEAIAGDTDDAGPEVGAMISPEASFGTLVLDGRLPNLIADTRTHPLASALPVAEEYRIGSYIGVPIPGDGPLPYGMLTCISRSANPTLDETDVGFLEMLATMAASLTTGEDTGSERRRRLRDRIGRVLRQRQLTTVFQPIMALDTGQVVGAEALTRFPAEPVRPDLWFADAESVGLGIALELAAIREAIAHLDALPGGVYLSLNASPGPCAPPSSSPPWPSSRRDGWWSS